MVRTKISSLLGKITVLFVICCCCLPAQGKYGGGTGEPNNPYLIYTASHMQAIGADANDWDKHFRLCADIDLSAFTGTSFNIIGTGYIECSPLGNCYFVGTPFTGSFDGNGHNISNFTYSYTGIYFIGLFGVVDGENAEIKNLRLIDPNVAVEANAGSLVGYLLNGTITDCYVEGGSITGDRAVGGFIGSTGRDTLVSNCYSKTCVLGGDETGGLIASNGGTVVRCYSRVYVVGHYDVGGLAGHNSGTISDCNSDGNISGMSRLGGLVGCNVDSITNCCSTASVSGSEVVGGLVGSNGGTITKCYSSGSVSGEYVGGLVGYNGATITNCYSTASVSGNEYVGALVGSNAATITDCNSTGSVIGNYDVGGLVGINRGTITNSYSTASVSGKYGVGGLVGLNSRGTIANCYAMSIVVGEDYVGGLVGRNGYCYKTWCYPGTIANCYSTSSVTGDDYVGGLVGYNIDGTITNCYSTGYVSGDESVGGLVGRNNGTITDSYSTGSVIGNHDVGGLVGINVETITNSCSTASVSGKRCVGGLVGFNGYVGTIANCYSSGSVSGYQSVGGLVGTNSNGGTITNCYSIGGVSGGGGLVGSNGGKISSCYWDIETSGQDWSAGGAGLTTAEMQMAITFVCWIYEYVWAIDEGVDYPRLVWENKPGELITVPSDLYGGGSGEPNDPYLIYTAEHLNIIGLIPCYLDKHIKLMADIDLGGYTGTSFNIIGNYEYPFTGVFDGNDHTISNFSYDSNNTNYIGLFGGVGVGGVIKKLGLIEPNVSAGNGNYVGSLVADNWGNITNCYVEGGSVSGMGGVGRLVGRNNSTITNSCSTGSVSAVWDVGGLVGVNGGTITNCYSAGSVSGDSEIGGLVGRQPFGTITNCYSTVSVSGDDSVGGLVGFDFQGSITNCYATGSVSGHNKWIGGLVGYTNLGKISASFWDIETSGQDTSDGGTGKTTAEMQMASTFVSWVCDHVWTIDEGNDYPRLWWENMPGVSITPQLYLSGGSGEPKDPYLIYTAEQLNAIGLLSCEWDKRFKLMVDIDLGEFTGTAFNIIGNSTTKFTGVFDGNGHTISNFSYSSTDTSCIGLFGYIDDNNAEIKDLGLINVEVDAGTGDCIGSLVGYLYFGVITNCYVEGGSVSGHDYVGGLVGKSREGTINDCQANDGSVSGNYGIGGLVGGNYWGTNTSCHSAGSVTGQLYVGGLVGDNRGKITGCSSTGNIVGDSYISGLVGYNYNGTITNSYSTGSVLGDVDVGGLVGFNKWGTITNCYSTGSVSGDELVGGLVGYNSYGTISNCYSTGSVSGDELVGGLAGKYYKGTVTTSFWDIETSGQTTSDGGTGLPTDQMQMASTFTDAGWDFVGETVNGIEDLWFIPQQDYPHLWWEGMKVPMKLTPHTLNCRSEGNWVKAHITMPEGFTVADVNSERPAVLHSFGFQSTPPYVFVNKDKLVEIEAAFQRDAVCSLADDWPDELTVAGFLTNGNIFLGTSSVRIIHPGMKVIEDLAWYWLNADCVHPDFCDGIDMNRDSLVNLLDYALLMNINVEFVTDE